MDIISTYEAFFFDMDGVLYLGNEPIPGAADVLHYLRSQGKHVSVITNNSSKSADEISDRLQSLGFPADDIHVHIATHFTASWLAETKQDGLAYVLGNEGLHKEIEQAGITIDMNPTGKEDEYDFLVVGNDRQINFQKLTKATRLGRTNVKFISVNEDPLYPTDEGMVPGAGALIAALSHAIGRSPDLRIGKPSPFLIQHAMQKANLSADKCIMIGDTLEIDIRMGNNANVDTALVLTGVDSKATMQKSTAKPTYVLKSVADLIDF